MEAQPTVLQFSSFMLAASPIHYSYPQLPIQRIKKRAKRGRERERQTPFPIPLDINFKAPYPLEAFSPSPPSPSLSSSLPVFLPNTSIKLHPTPGAHKLPYLTYPGIKLSHQATKINKQM